MDGYRAVLTLELWVDANQVCIVRVVLMDPVHVDIIKKSNLRLASNVPQLRYLKYSKSNCLKEL
jgi:hypothetical protein